MLLHPRCKWYVPREWPLTLKVLTKYANFKRTLNMSIPWCLWSSGDDRRWVYFPFISPTTGFYPETEGSSSSLKYKFYNTYLHCCNNKPHCKTMWYYIIPWYVKQKRERLPPNRDVCLPVKHKAHSSTDVISQVCHWTDITSYFLGRCEVNTTKVSRTESRGKPHKLSNWSVHKDQEVSLIDWMKSKGLQKKIKITQIFEEYFRVG